MKIENADKYLKLEIVEEINKFTKINAVLKEKIPIIVDDYEYSIINYSLVKNCLHVSACKEAQSIKKEELDFICNDFFYDKNANIILISDPEKQFEIDDKKVLKEEFFEKNNNLEINFGVSWIFNEFNCDSFNTSLKTSDFKKLSNKLPLSYCEYKNFRVFNSDIENVEVNYEKGNDEFVFFPVTKFDYSMVYENSFDVLANEDISFYFKKSDKYSIKKLNFNLKLPVFNNYFVWNSNRIFFEGDVVLYEKKFYKCIKNNKEEKFVENCWEENNNKKEVSFYNISSFFNNDYGQSQISKIKNSLQYIVEKQVGNCIQLSFINPNIFPSLNEWFSYKEKNYRIVKIEFKLISNLKYYVVLGRELFEKFDLSKGCEKYVEDGYFAENEDYIENLEWDYIMDEILEKQVKIIAHNYEEEFEGITMQLPQKLKSFKKKKLNFYVK